MLDVEGTRRIQKRTSIEDLDGATSQEVDLNNPIRSAPFWANAESTVFVVDIKSVKRLGNMAGQDTWQNLFTIPTLRAHASLGVPLPNSPLNDKRGL